MINQWPRCCSRMTHNTIHINETNKRVSISTSCGPSSTRRFYQREKQPRTSNLIALFRNSPIFMIIELYEKRKKRGPQINFPFPLAVPASSSSPGLFGLFKCHVDNFPADQMDWRFWGRGCSRLRLLSAKYCANWRFSYCSWLPPARVSGLPLSVLPYTSRPQLRWFLRNKKWRTIFWKLCLIVLYHVLFRIIQ